MSKSRRWLYGVMAAGLIGLGAGGGTFATFNAATTNPGNTFATGSLYLSNTVGSGNACFSYNGTDNDNPGCDTVVDVSKQYPGATIATGTVTVANVGSISGSTLDLYSAGCTDSDVTITTDAVATVTPGSATVTITGSTFLTLGVDQSMTLTDTAGDITSPIGIVSISGNTLMLASDAGGSQQYTNDKLQFVSQTSTTGNPLCGAVVAYVEETGQTDEAGTPTTSNTYCWYGDGVGGSTCDTTPSNLNALGANTDTLTTLANYTSGSPLELHLLGSSGNTTAGNELAAGTGRAFTIGLYLPDTSGDQNNLMDLQSNFSLTWKIAQ